MFIELSWENFKRILTETNTGLIFVKEKPTETGSCIYEFFTNSNSFWVRTSYECLSVEEAIVFKEKFASGHKIMYYESISEEKVNLSISQV